MNSARDSWSGRIGFILATIGAAVGLGSIWEFPYEVGSNGGSAFLLFYIIGLVVIVAPLMFPEFAIGRRGGSDATTSMARIAAAYGASRWWAAAGALGIFTGVLVLSYYSVIGGWTIAYAAETVMTGLAGNEPQAAQARFDALLASPAYMIAVHAIFMAATAAIVSRGIGDGIEAASKMLMPVLVLLMLGLTAYSVIEGDVAATVRFLFKLDPQYLTARTALDALGLGFFSIGVGFALMITYAAYAGHDLNLRQMALAVRSARLVELAYTVFRQQLVCVGGMRTPHGLCDVGLGRLLAAPGQDNRRFGGMLGQISAKVVDFATNGHPTVILFIVLCDFRQQIASVGGNGGGARLFCRQE